MPRSAEVRVICKSKFDQVSLHLQICLDQLLRNFVDLRKLLLNLSLRIPCTYNQILSYLISYDLLCVELLEHLFSTGYVFLFKQFLLGHRQFGRLREGTSGRISTTVRHLSVHIFNPLLVSMKHILILGKQCHIHRFLRRLLRLGRRSLLFACFLFFQLHLGILARIRGVLLSYLFRLSQRRCWLRLARLRLFARGCGL